ncbi:MAG: response regulator [Leptospiraceae bacterium]|nr:response regulator [Leptospiraceae bacterium]MDW7976020.1 response regulator [Leptospiraceae bacterium]
MNVYIFDYDLAIHDFYRNFFKNEFRNVLLKFFFNKETLLNEINVNPPDLIILECDIENPFDLFENLRKKNLLFIVVSRLFSERIIVESLKSGAYDYIYKSNLKYDYLKFVLARAFLDLPRWKKILNFAENTEYLPEFNNYNSKLKQITFDSRFYEKWSLPLPKFYEGNSYVLNFLTVRLPFSYNASLFLTTEEEFQKLHQNFLFEFAEICKNFNSEVWIKKNDSFTSVYHKDNYLEPILTFLHIYAKFIDILSKNEIEKLRLICAIEQGSVTYTEKKENIYCEAINLTYHIVEKFESTYKLYITQTIYDGLNQRAKQYFFKESQMFEGRIIYHFDYIS